MAFPPSFLEDLRQRVSITDVVGRKVRLIRRGHEASGLCPFHNEKSPSFTVSEEKGFYHCFGCGAHGDVIGFVMNSDGLDFRNAVEKLAAEAGISVPQETQESRERAERQATLTGVMELAAKFFESQLGASAGRAGLDYLQRRGLTAETIKRFRLGFAPDNRTALKAHLEKQAIPEALSVEAGLLIQPEEGGSSYDRFRGRVMFPILDRRGQVIAFGGRILTDEKPKYLNSPETPLFHKGRVLYGLSHAQKAARDKNEVIVAEGYMDVIALAQAGFPQAVAPLGTALTEEQIELLWRLAPEPILCFDGDSAGQKAAARVAERALPLLKPGLSLYFVNLTNDETGEKEDPDSFLRKHSSADFAEFLESKKTALSGLLWQILLQGRLVDTPERRAAFRKAVDNMVKLIADSAVREEYHRHFQIFLQSMLGAAEGGGRLALGVRRGWRSSAAELQGPARKYKASEWRLLPEFQKEWGGEAARAGIEKLQRLPYECLLATALFHTELLHKYSEVLISLDFLAPDLDSTRRKIIEIANRYPSLSSPNVWTLLVQEGLQEALARISAKTYYMKFTLPSADLASAEEGFLHVLSILRERDLRREMDIAAKDWAQNQTDESWQRFESLRSLVLESESRRRDIDRDAFGQTIRK
jgi:DNA primase